MKKSLVLMAMAGVSLASCVNNEVVDVPQKEQEKVRIAFDKPVTYSNVESRVNYYGEIGEHQYNGDKRSYPKEEQFKIFAVWDDKPRGFDGWPETPEEGKEKEGDFAEFNTDALSYDFFVDSWAPKKQVPKKDANGDDISGQYEYLYYYWPGDKYLSFSAVSPSDLSKFYNTTVDHEAEQIDRSDVTSSVNYTATPTISYGKYTDGSSQYLGLQIKNFETPSLPEYHYDLLFSQLAINNDKTTQDQNENASHYSGLPVKFQHALSCIRFSFVTDEDEVPIYLQGITLTGARTKGGNFAENINVNNIVDWSNFTYSRRESEEDADYNVDPKWTFTTGVDLGTSVPFDAFKMGDETDYDGVQFTGTPTYVEGRINATKGDEYYDLFLMPQSLDGISIIVKFKVGDGASQSKIYSLSSLYHHSDVNKEDPIQSWEVGKRYAYRLYYSQAAAKKDRILFSPGTDGWTDVEGIVVDLAHSGSVASGSN